jgi:hypothetical protein
MSYDIGPQSTFYGYIPDDSDELHLGIVINEKGQLVKYCYCTSKFKAIYTETDFIHVAKEKMAVYFPEEPRDTYIYISQRHIIDILLITLVSRIDSNEYDLREPIDTNIYIAIISRIRNSDNLSERFKNEIFRFLE